MLCPKRSVHYVKAHNSLHSYLQSATKSGIWKIFYVNVWLIVVLTCVISRESFYFEQKLTLCTIL